MLQHGDDPKSEMRNNCTGEEGSNVGSAVLEQGTEDGNRCSNGEVGLQQERRQSTRSHSREWKSLFERRAEGGKKRWWEVAGAFR